VTSPAQAARHEEASPTQVPREHALDLLRSMLRIRRFEERCVELYSQARIRGFLHLYIGEEAIAAGVMPALRPDDPVVATYREHGHALARGISMNAIMAEMFGKVEGCSRGRGGSMHLFDAGTRFYGGSAIVGGGLPLAVGIGLAEQMQQRHTVTVCFFGDGAVAEGEFHESLNLAAVWKLPVLFLCENNRYAMGTAIDRALANTDISAKASAYNISSESVDGMDVLAVEEATRRAVDAVREGGPHLIEFRTYRYRAHSMYDPDLYRSKEEVERWRERDPLLTFPEQLRAAGQLEDSTLAAMEREIAAEIEAAIAYADAGTLEPVTDLTRFVYTEQQPA
jgi:pyruvate dehydrogenase E1 component alpha subunit